MRIILLAPAIAAAGRPAGVPPFQAVVPVNPRASRLAMFGVDQQIFVILDPARPVCLALA